jgi:hypothetical protein
MFTEDWMAEVWRENCESQWHDANSKLRFGAFFKRRPNHHITLWRIEDRRVAVVASSTGGVANGDGKQRMACTTFVGSPELPYGSGGKPDIVSRSSVMITAPKVGTKMGEDGTWSRKKKVC